MEILGSNGQITDDNNEDDENHNNKHSNNNNIDQENMFHSVDSIISYPINERSYISDITESVQIGTGSDILLPDTINEREKKGKGRK